MNQIPRCNLHDVKKHLPRQIGHEKDVSRYDLDLYHADNPVTPSKKGSPGTTQILLFEFATFTENDLLVHHAKTEIQGDD